MSESDPAASRADRANGTPLTDIQTAGDGPTLSPRQRTCLERVAVGETSCEIAGALRLSVRTVDQHVAEACVRLGVRRRASAVARALRLGLISLSPVQRD